MLDLKQKEAAEPNQQLRERQYSRNIESIDKKIDEAVYALYGLTPEEIKIVEGTSGDS
jgi:hypothetical protein